MPTFQCTICYEDLSCIPSDRLKDGIGLEVDNEINKLLLDEGNNNNRIAALPCGHVFHDFCLQKWITHEAVFQFRCPFCNQGTYNHQVKTILFLSQTDESDYSVFSPDSLTKAEANLLKNELMDLRRHVRQLSTQLQLNQKLAQDKSNQVDNLLAHNNYLQMRYTHAESQRLRDKAALESRIRDAVGSQFAVYRQKVKLEKELLHLRSIIKSHPPRSQHHKPGPIRSPIHINIKKEYIEPEFCQKNMYDANGPAIHNPQTQHGSHGVIWADGAPRMPMPTHGQPPFASRAPDAVATSSCDTGTSRSDTRMAHASFPWRSWMSSSGSTLSRDEPVDLSYSAMDYQEPQFVEQPQWQWPVITLD